MTDPATCNNCALRLTCSDYAPHDICSRHKMAVSTDCNLCIARHTCEAVSLDKLGQCRDFAMQTEPAKFRRRLMVDPGPDKLSDEDLVKMYSPPVAAERLTPRPPTTATGKLTAALLVLSGLHREMSQAFGELAASVGGPNFEAELLRLSFKVSDWQEEATACMRQVVLYMKEV